MKDGILFFCQCLEARAGHLHGFSGPTNAKYAQAGTLFQRNPMHMDGYTCKHMGDMLWQHHESSTFFSLK